MRQYNLVKVNGSPFVRDINSMALMNTDDNAKNEYYSKLKMMKMQKDEINNMKSDIASVMGDLAEVKSLLLKILNKD